VAGKVRFTLQRFGWSDKAQARARHSNAVFIKHNDGERVGFWRVNRR